MMCTFQPPLTDRSVPSTAQRHLLTELVFDELTSFESVSDQYDHLGMRLEGAIAIRPSNPVFRPASDTLVLMPEAACSPIVIWFEQPVQYVSATVNGARQVRLTGFDRHSNVLAHERTPTRLPQIPAESIEAFPLHSLQIDVAGLARVVLASDAPFLLHHLSYR